MIRPALPVLGRRTTTRLMAAVVASAAALSVAGAGSPAASAPDAQCPAAAPVADLVPGELVHGLTVSKGTTPEPFTGEHLGVLKDGIAPGRDMILVDLTSAEIDRVGIWSGMSGSPVYAEDGDLIGAVSYGLSLGPSSVAGVTPAADMHELLTQTPAGPMSAAADKITIPDRLADRLVTQDVATNAEVGAGLSQLQLPFGMAGLSGRRVKQVANKLDLDLNGMRLNSAMGASALADTSMVAGGNVAAAISYGDITAAGVGTVTAVCGGEVLGFGHPMLWTGPSGLSMHAASVIYVQEDPTLSGFKVANIDPSPVGSITHDRMAGILGVQGAAPDTGDITTSVSMPGRNSRNGETKVNLPEWMPDIAFAHILANHDRVFDGIGQGSANVNWTVNGTREDGAPFSISRGDVHASEYDVTFEAAWDVVMALYTLEYNGVEDITIDSVHVDSKLSRDYDHYVFKKAEIKRAGVWNKLSRSTPLFLKPGKEHKIKVTVESADSGSSSTVKTVRVPRSADGRRGFLNVRGGNTFDGDEFYGGNKQTFDSILADLKSEPRNDEILIHLGFYNNRGRITNELERRTSTGLVVDGGTSIRVRAIG
ncbi:SpoIVB peptidase S55 domain-containing protein [soil metagenome]